VEIQGFPYPFIYAETLKVRLMMQVHCPMSIVNNGRCWSSKLNCQKFTQKAIEYLGFVFPEDILIASDCMLCLVDIYLTARLSTAQSLEEKKKTADYLC
jgi:hypothetical protein